MIKLTSFAFLSLMSVSAFAKEYTYTNNLPLFTKLIASRDIVLEASTSKYVPGEFKSKCHLEYPETQYERVIPAGTELTVHSTQGSRYGALYTTQDGIKLSCDGYPWGSFKELISDFRGSFSIELPANDFDEPVDQEMEKSPE